MPEPESKARCMIEDAAGNRTCDEDATALVLVETVSLAKAKCFCATHLVTFAYENLRREWEQKGRAGG